MGTVGGFGVCLGISVFLVSVPRQPRKSRQPRRSAHTASTLLHHRISFGEKWLRRRKGTHGHEVREGVVPPQGVSAQTRSFAGDLHRKKSSYCCSAMHTKEDWTLVAVGGRKMSL